MIWLFGTVTRPTARPTRTARLTDKGREQSRAAGAALQALGVEIDACLTSPKVRAADTARIACAELGGVEPQLEPKLAGGPFDAEALAAGLGDDVLLVGHDPDFSAAVHSLTGAQVRHEEGRAGGGRPGRAHGAAAPARAEGDRRAR